MKGDFTRVTFRPGNHYSGVLQQQGRVQLDADWNEQVAIDAHRDRITARDLIGARGTPCDGTGFALTCDGAEIPAAGCAAEDLRIEDGRYYVDGLLVEIDDPVDLGDQPDLPGVVAPETDGTYLAYLDVWEQHLTALERAALREVALGGPDTATRTRTVWQLKLEPLGGGTQACSDFGADWIPGGAASTGRLAARAASSGPITDPCIIPPAAGFRRLENQLYRVEIHAGSQGAAGAAQTPTYKWSRDNGSVVLQVAGIVDTVISVTQPARDAVLGFAAGDWVEISDEGRTLRGEPGILVQLADAQATELTVTAWSGGPPPLSPDFATTVRRWDSAGAVDVVRGSWLDLEDGVQVKFEDVAAQTYRTGDHWLIPARSADIEGVSTNVGGDVEWPDDRSTGEPAFEGRHGVEHHYAPIALLERTTTGGNSTWRRQSDCRLRFPSLTDLTALDYAGGDGQEAMPGDPLPQPLKVAVRNGGCAIESAVVRFSTEDGGTLSGDASSGPTIDVPVDDDGMASCSWTLAADWAKPSQRARATLLDDHGDPVGTPIDFSGNLSIAAQVAYDPAGCEALAAETTVQDAVHHLAAASSIVAWCGDGQAALPGTPLPQPLEIEVASACGPTGGAKVEFRAEGAGKVAASVADLGGAGSTFAATTGADGRISAVWQLDETGAPSQRMQVALVGSPDGPVEEPAETCFVGQLNLASEVAYDGAGCKPLSETQTVQEALDALCANAALLYVSGDGQEAQPGRKLPHPLQVRVANGQWPVAGARVLFRVASGDGTVEGEPEAAAQTNSNGIAQVGWTLGPKGPQRVEARLSDAKAFTVAFNAQFSDVGRGGSEDEPGIRIVAVTLGRGELPNDESVAVEELGRGIIVHFDQPIGAVVRGGVRSQPVMTLTVDVPFLEAGDGPVVAFQPFIVRANMDSMGDALLWVPWDGSVLEWLRRQVEMAHEGGLEGVLAHLVLKGNFVWGEDSSLYVDGNSFGTDAGGRTEILRTREGFMSGDGRRGGDFEMWFWLVL